MITTDILDPSKVTFGKIISPGVKFIKRVVINLDDIHIPAIKENPTRSKGKDIPHIQIMENCFKNGINYSLMPPVVREKSQLIDGHITKYEVVGGQHRVEALRNLGEKEWIFDIYEIPSDSKYGYEDAIRTFQLKENNHAPALRSTESDVVNTIVRLIAHSSKLVYPNEDSIKDYVNDVCSNMHPNTRAKIVRDAMRQLQKNGCNVYRDVITYTASDVNDFLSKKTDYVCGGDFDFKRKKSGWSVLEGYEYEFLINATKHFAERGIESYFTIHTKSPTESYSVNDRRKKMQDQFKSLENSLIKVFEYYTKNGKFPWHIEGALPQDIANLEKEYIKL